jgi:hypothetical protein
LKMPAPGASAWPRPEARCGCHHPREVAALIEAMRLSDSFAAAARMRERLPAEDNLALWAEVIESLSRGRLQVRRKIRPAKACGTIYEEW